MIDKLKSILGVEPDTTKKVEQLAQNVAAIEAATARKAELAKAAEELANQLGTDALGENPDENAIRQLAQVHTEAVIADRALKGAERRARLDAAVVRTGAFQLYAKLRSRLSANLENARGISRRQLGKYFDEHRLEGAVSDSILVRDAGGMLDRCPSCGLGNPAAAELEPSITPGEVLRTYRALADALSQAETTAA